MCGAARRGENVCGLRSQSHRLVQSRRIHRIGTLSMFSSLGPAALTMAWCQSFVDVLST